MCAVKSEETVALENGKQVERPKSDFWNICLLLLLYALQAIPQGFINAMPLLLQSRGVRYTDQAIFNIVHFPYSVKLLWAPIIDSVYFKKIGKRKTWIISSQYLLGTFFFILSLNIDKWLASDDKDSGQINIGMLTVFMLCINVFRATQDIALDGWSLTILQKENIGYSSHSAMIGNRIGLYISYVLFTVLNSTEFCNEWVRDTPQDYPIISIPDFLLFWSVFFTVVTTLLLFFKKENDPKHYPEDYEDGTPELTLGKSYRLLIDLCKIKPLRTLCAALLVCRAGMGPLHVLTPLKLIDAGISRDKLVLIAMPVIPLLALLPFVMKRYLVSHKSMVGFNFVLSCWGLVSLSTGSFMYFTSKIKKNNGEFPLYYYAILFVVDGIEKISVYLSALTLQALFYRVSDRNFGGTYITLLNMLMSFGKEWTVNLSLWLVEPLTWNKCTLPPPPLCDDDVRVTEPICTTFIDGYYTELALGTLGTIIWLTCGGRQIMLRLQKIHPSEWRITGKPENKEKEKSSMNDLNLIKK